MTIYYEPADVAKLLGVTPATVCNLANRGRLPLAARSARGTRLFDPAAVQTFIRERDRTV